MVIVRLLFWWLVISALAGAEPTMLKIVVRNVTPDLDPKSFVALPRTIYRSGRTHARVEEQPDPADGVHLVMIRAGSESWSLDLNRKSARHSGNLPPDVRLPIFMMDDGSYIMEFGYEIAFMQDHQVPPTEVKLSSGQTLNRYAVKSGDRFVELLTSQGRPVFTQMRNPQGKVLMRLQYDEFTPDLPHQPSLYQLPPGTTVEERP